MITIKISYISGTYNNYYQSLGLKKKISFLPFCFFFCYKFSVYRSGFLQQDGFIIYRLTSKPKHLKISFKCKHCFKEWETLRQHNIIVIKFDTVHNVSKEDFKD